MMQTWTWMQRHLAGPRPKFALALLVTALLVACSGEDGAPGLDGVSPDVNPPAVALLSPTAGDTVGDTMRVTVSAVDNIAIDRVVFFVDGSDVVDDTTVAEVSGEEAADNLYSWTFDLLALELPSGPHTVMARAYDVDGNSTDTPPVIVHSVREVPPGPAVLRAWDPDSTGFYLFPTRNVGGTAIDTLHNVRLRAERDARVDSIRLYLSGTAAATLNYDADLVIGLHRSDGVYPLEGDPLSSGLLEIAGLDTLDSTGWFSTTLTDAVNLSAGEIFHVSVNADSLSDTTKYAIGTSVVTKYDYPTLSPSSRFRTDLDRWESLQLQYELEARTREFMIEVWVTYE